MREGAPVVVHGLIKRFPVRRPLGEVLRRPLSRKWKQALAGVDLEVGRGEVFGLLGPNGSGKTTILKVLATIFLPTAGRALVEGRDVTREPGEVRRRVGCLFDPERGFYHRLTGRENLAFYAALDGLSRREGARRIEELLARFGLEGSGRVPVMNYSKGMQQRLGLARALLADPPVLLLDEPSRSLDPGSAAAFRRALREDLASRSGKTVVLATHSLEEGRACCDRAAVLDEGRISSQGAWPEVERFFAQPGDRAG